MTGGPNLEREVIGNLRYQFERNKDLTDMGVSAILRCEPDTRGVHTAHHGAEPSGGSSGSSHAPCMHATLPSANNMSAAPLVLQRRNRCDSSAPADGVGALADFCFRRLPPDCFPPCVLLCSTLSLLLSVRHKAEMEVQESLLMWKTKSHVCNMIMQDSAPPLAALMAKQQQETQLPQQAKESPFLTEFYQG